MPPMLSNETDLSSRQLEGTSPKMDLNTDSTKEPRSSLQCLLAMTSSPNIFKDNPIKTMASNTTPEKSACSLSSSLSSSLYTSAITSPVIQRLKARTEATTSDPMNNLSSSPSNLNSLQIKPNSLLRNHDSSVNNQVDLPSKLSNSHGNLSGPSRIFCSSHSNWGDSPNNLSSSPSNLSSSPSNPSSSPRNLGSSNSNCRDSPSNLNSLPSNLSSSSNNRFPSNVDGPHCLPNTNTSGSPGNIDISPSNLNISPSNSSSLYTLQNTTSPPNSSPSSMSSSSITYSTSPSSSPSGSSSSSSETNHTFTENLSSALTELGTQGQSQEMQTSKPCTVCGEPTRGIYYGAVTCLPCKTFFVRYSGETRTMKCRTGRRNCDINEATRVSCKACRYAKCLSAGMRRKERPEKQLPLIGQPTCAVCGDVANGLHFGVFTCEGCKKFFRRGLDEHIGYKCKHSLACRMNPRTRNLCRLCRFQRCVEVGMSLEGIRFGRRKKQKEVQPMTTTSSSSDTDMVELPSQYNRPQYQPQQFPNSPMDLSPNHHRPGSTSDGASSCSSPRSSPDFQEGAPQQQAVPQTFYPYQGLPEEQPIQHQEQYSYDDIEVQGVYEQKESGGYGYGTDPTTAACPLRLQVPTETARGSNVCAGPPPDHLNTNWDHRPQPEVIQYWQRSVPLEVNSMTPEQRHLLSTTLSLYEPQKVCITLDPASNTVTTLPGLLALRHGNVDNAAIQNITNFVIFAKSLPGFDRIHRADQYTLIRLGSTETRILSSAVFDTRSLDSQLEEAYRQKSPIHFKFLKTTLSISKTVRLLNLDDTESCLLFVLCLIAADQPGLHDPNVIEEVRQDYIASLASYIEDNHGDAFSRLSAIFSVMPRVRQMGRWYCELINNVHFALPENRAKSEQLYTTM